MSHFTIATGVKWDSVLRVKWDTVKLHQNGYVYIVVLQPLYPLGLAYLLNVSKLDFKQIIVMPMFFCLRCRTADLTMGKCRPKSKCLKKQKTTGRKGRKLNKWEADRMQKAVDEFHKGTVGLRQLARAWSVPKSTLQRRIKGLVAGTQHASGRKNVMGLQRDRNVRNPSLRRQQIKRL